MAVDATGHLFIADDGNHRVLELDLTTGVMTDFAGDGTPYSGGDGGPATAAHLLNPVGVALDPAGNVLIVEDGRVREVDHATGIITTIAGGAGDGYGGDGGPPTAAELSFPSGIAVDGSGDLFIADQHNGRIREVSAKSPPAFTAGSPPSGTYGVSYSYQFQATGTPAPTYTATGLPAWATLDPHTGNLTGTPTAAGSFTFTVTASNGVPPDAPLTVTLTVAPAGQTISFALPPGPVTYGAAPIPLSATGGGSGNPIVYTVVSGPGTITGGDLVVTGAGAIVVEADQAGTADYAPAAPVRQTLTVVPAGQTISFALPPGPVTYGVAPIPSPPPAGGPAIR